MTISQRDNRIDFYKGMLMWSIVWGHTITALQNGWCSIPVWIHSFFRIYDLPFFMLLSGFFFHKSVNKYPSKYVLADKICSLLLPLVFWNVLLLSWEKYYFIGAVFLCSLICLGIHEISIKTSPWVGWLLCILLIVSFHFIKVPFKLFFLFPFFVVGYHLSNLNFSFKWYVNIFIGIFFIVGVCFWKSAYGMWGTGWDAWKISGNAVLIYVFRFVLGLCGIVVMKQLFTLLYNVLPMKIVSIINQVGRETLGIYILQGIVIEIILQNGIGKLDMAIVSGQQMLYHYLVGYLLAPLISLFTIIGLAWIVNKIKATKMTSWMFGYKISSTDWYQNMIVKKETTS